MTWKQLTARASAAVAVTTMIAACSQLGSLGSVLGGLGGSQALAGTVRGVNTQSQYIALQQNNGQDLSLQYDNQTRVTYQNQAYPVTSLDPGDQVTAYVSQAQDGSYYADSVEVVQPVNGSTTGSNTGALQSLQGSVRSIDRSNGTFALNAGNGVVLTVSLPYNASSAITTRYNQLRNGDYVSFYGVYVAARRVELRQFN